LIDAITNKLKLTQASIVIDRMELLTSLLGPEETLKFVKMIKQADSKCGLYPFFGHADFSMTTSHPQFDVRLSKIQNGFCRLESTKFNAKTSVFQAHLYTTVVKSGCRFVDEHCIVEKGATTPFVHYLSNALGLSPDASSLTEAMQAASIKKKEQAVKATFKIEMNDEEKKARDSQTTNVYHTKHLITID